MAMRLSGTAVLGLLLTCGAALAQSQYPTPRGENVGGVALMCVNSQYQAVPCNSTTPLAISGSFSATLTGFHPAAFGTPFTATTSGVTGTLPAGAVVVVSNAGGTNTAYCQLGASATTSAQPIPPNSWFAYTISGETQVTCITSTSTTTINTAGGTGLPTGAGGGGGGGGGSSSITSWGGGTLGAMANYGTSPGAVLVPGVNAFITNSPTVTANAGTNLNTSALALETGGNLATIAGTVASSRVNANSRITGNAGAILDFPGQNAASPANAALIGGQFNTSPTTISSGNASPLQLTSAGSLKSLDDNSAALLAAAQAGTGTTGSAVPSSAIYIGGNKSGNLAGLLLDASGYLSINCQVGCSSSGGSSLTDEGTFTQGTTAFTVMGGIYNTSIANLTSGQAGAAQLTIDRMLYTNLGKVGGTATATGNGTSGAGNLRVNLASDNSAVSGLGAGATGSAVPPNAVLQGTSFGGNTTAIVGDPCQLAAKTNVAISQTANTKLFSQASSKKNYICALFIVGSDAENVSLVEGTGSTCGTSTAAIIGGTTAAAGPHLSANGGWSQGNGSGSVAQGTNANFDVCLLQSGSGTVAGNLTYVQM
jgi:hypothetical protein